MTALAPDQGLRYDRLTLASLVEDWRGAQRARMPRALPERLSPCAISTGPRRHRCSLAHAQLVEGYWIARHAGELAEEEVTIGYPTERREYRAAGLLVTFRRWLRSSRRDPQETP